MVSVEGVRISHPERALWPELGLTKLDLCRYYEAIADWMLPHVVGRPLTLVRGEQGVEGPTVFMRHSRVWGPWPLRRVKIREKTKLGEYLVIERAASLVALAQMDILEIHTWNTRAEHLEQPDRLVIDLDPGPEVKWPQVVAAAREVRAALRSVRLESWVKTTGGAGLHVGVPLLPERDWSEVLAFARAFAQALERGAPRHFTTAFAKQGREKKILLDYLRNNRTNTSVAAFSPRARPHAPVSVPIAWEELSPRLRPERFTLATVPRRLARLRADPWRGYWTSNQSLGSAPGLSGASAPSRASPAPRP